MRKILLFTIFVLMSTLAYGDITITQDQFDNLDVITQAIKEKHAGFIGFYGAKTAMKVAGDVSEADVLKEINKLNIADLITEKEEKLKGDKKKDILELIGLTEIEIDKIKQLP